ncbi:MAG: AAA family ATPase [Candidatus Omnitrophota bacterium]
MAKKLFIAATMQNDGKTTVSLGLIAALKKYFKRIGFIKPIGQRYLIEQGYKVDEDSVLIEDIFGIKTNIKDMSPIAIEKGFTEKYINKPNKKALITQIEKSFEKVSKNRDLVIIEGTGHAGVGSVFDLSNATVAKLLGAKVIIVSSGGIGRPIDEIILNQALFEKEGVEILGVIINKVLPEKIDKVNYFVRKGFLRKGLRVLGVLPYNPFLTAPTMKQLKEELHLQILSGEDNLKRTVKKIIVGAMEPHDAINYIEDKSLIITPGDREDIILTALSVHTIGLKKRLQISGIILSGGIMPNTTIMQLVKNSGIPVLLSQKDTYAVASDVHDLRVKISPEDKQKAKIVMDLVGRHVDIKEILKQL